MPIKVTVTPNEAVTEPEYPRVMISNNGKGLIVRFTDSTTGVVLDDPINPNNIGWSTRHWDVRDFTPFHGTITWECL